MLLPQNILIFDFNIKNLKDFSEQNFFALTSLDGTLCIHKFFLFTNEEMNIPINQ